MKTISGLLLVAVLILACNNAVHSSETSFCEDFQPRWKRTAPPWALPILTHKSIASRFRIGYSKIGRDFNHQDEDDGGLSDLNHDRESDYFNLAYDQVNNKWGLLIVNQGERQVHFAAFYLKSGSTRTRNSIIHVRWSLRRNALHGEFIAVWIEEEESIGSTIHGIEVFETRSVGPEAALIWNGSGYNWSVLQE